MKKFLLAVLAVLTTGSTTLAQPCTPQFQPGYDYGSLVAVAANNIVLAEGAIERAVVFDDQSGAGPVIYAAGSGMATPGSATCYLAKFVNGRWTAITGFDHAIHALAVADLGDGPRLFVGGDFTTIPGAQPASGAAVWDGMSWSRFGAANMLGTRCLLGTQTLTGPALFAGGGGTFIPAFVSQWNGTDWAPLGGVAPGGSTGVTGRAGVRALAYFNDGSGPKLYAGGSLSWGTFGTQWGVAAWDGAVWTSIPGMTYVGSWSDLTCLTVHNDPDGPHLYAGGYFFYAPTLPLGSPEPLARLVNGSWQLLSAPNTGGVQEQSPDGCSALMSIDAPGGAILCGTFGIDARRANVVKFYQNGVWSGSPGIFSGNLSSLNLTALVMMPSTGRPCVFGNFTGTFTSRAPCAAAWNGVGWDAIENIGLGLTSAASLLSDPITDDDPIYANGWRFISGARLPGDVVVPNNQPMTPTSYVHLQNPVPTRVISGFYGMFTDDGTGWTWIQRPGSGDYRLWVATDTPVESLIATAGGIIFRRVNGAWTPVTTGFPNGVINAVETYADANGPRLYVGGRLGTLETSPRLAALQDGQWQTITMTGTVTGLKSFDFGSGPELAIATQRTSATQPGGLFAWNGVTMREVNTGLPTTNLSVTALRLMDTGNGPQLWCAANNALYMWNGTAWETSPNWVTSGDITSIDILKNPDATRSVFISGSFITAGNTSSARIAELKFCLPNCTADINHDGDSGTDADIEAFFACLAGTCCPTCTSADFNGDGDSGTDADIESFFRVLAGGVC